MATRASKSKTSGSSTPRVGVQEVPHDPAEGEVAAPSEGVSSPDGWSLIDGYGPKFGHPCEVKCGELESKAVRCPEGWWLNGSGVALTWTPIFWREIPADPIVDVA